MTLTIRRVARAPLGAGATLVVAALALTTAPAFAAPEDDAARYDALCTRALQSVVRVVGVRSDSTLRDASAGAPRRAARSVASGVIVDRKGHVVTAASVVENCDRVEVRLPDGRSVPAHLLGSDPASDVALLEIGVRDLPALAWAKAKGAPIGDTVLAVGQSGGGSPRRSVGTVRRRYDQPLSSLLLLTNAVYPGFSGGPALNTRGEIVGLVIGPVADAPADWSEGESVGSRASFALAGDDLRVVVDHLERFGHVRRGFLGVRMVQGEIVDSSHPGDPYKIGVRVEDVLPRSPAAQAGLKPGDLIVGWNGETLTSPEDLMRRVEGSEPGAKAAIVWVRNEERFDGTLVVGAKPDDDLLAVPGGTIAPVDPARANETLLDRMKTLRSRPPEAQPDSSGHAQPG